MEPTEERVIWNERFQGKHFDFRGKMLFTRFDSCEFVKCTLLIDHGTRAAGIYFMRVQRLQH